MEENVKTNSASVADKAESAQGEVNNGVATNSLKYKIFKYLPFVVLAAAFISLVFTFLIGVS
jgi:hypothetical protein